MLPVSFSDEENESARCAVIAAASSLIDAFVPFALLVPLPQAGLDACQHDGTTAYILEVGEGRVFASVVRIAGKLLRDGAATIKSL
jgi:hypothetical protein